MQFISKSFIKKVVVNETPYKHNSQTSPAFKDNRDFEKERNRLIFHINKTKDYLKRHQLFSDKSSLK